MREARNAELFLGLPGAVLLRQPIEVLRLAAVYLGQNAVIEGEFLKADVGIFSRLPCRVFRDAELGMRMGIVKHGLFKLGEGHPGSFGLGILPTPFYQHGKLSRTKHFAIGEKAGLAGEIPYAAILDWIFYAMIF